MPRSSELLKPALVLALGFVLGLGAASRFGGTGDEGRPGASGAARALDDAAVPAGQGTLVGLSMAPGPPTAGSVGTKAPAGDGSLPGSVEACQWESAATGPTPEELAENEALDRAATLQGIPAEIDHVEAELGPGTEGHTAPAPLEGQEGVPQQ